MAVRADGTGIGCERGWAADAILDIVPVDVRPREDARHGWFLQAEDMIEVAAVAWPTKPSLLPALLQVTSPL